MGDHMTTWLRFWPIHKPIPEGWEVVESWFKYPCKHHLFSVLIKWVGEGEPD